MGAIKVKASVRDGALADLSKTALQAVIALFEAGDYETLDDLGVSPPTVDRIRSLRASDLNRMNATSCRHNVVGFIWDDSAANRLLDSIQIRSEDEAVVEQLIKLYAPINMLEAVAGCTRIDIRRKRRLFNIECSSGRIEKLPIDRRDQIRSAWFENSDKPVLQRCIAVYENTGIKLDLAWDEIRTCMALEC